METYIDPNNPVIPVAVLGQNPGGGTNLGFYDAFQYLKTTPPNLPPQNVVDGSFFQLDLGTNNIFGIDGIVGNSNGINMLAACVDNLLQIIKIDGTNLVDVQQISDGQCNEASITGVPGMPDYFYASEYDANNTTINVFLTEDGGDNWNPFYDITQNFGGVPVGAANGGVRHDITGFNTALDGNAFNIRAGVCVNYTEAVDEAPDGLTYGVKCLDMVNNNPNNFFTQIFDRGAFPVTKIAESRSKITSEGVISTLYLKQLDDLFEWYLSEVEGLGSTPNTTDPLFLRTDPGNTQVLTFDFILIELNDAPDPQADVYYAGFDSTQVVVNTEKRTVRTPNIGNYPCNQSTDGIVTSIGLGYAMTDVGDGSIFIACPGGSLLISELILSDAAGIPTISQWGLIALTGLIVLFGAFALRRKARVTNS
ncbi:MAG: IPTL-CTERM sorting domain-containing protein [Candidatus Dadabacteria bacterium]|jgi:hypothetical protein|nr:IPTL-CTERM sorting domain-containing protein [Candidatus Dadabacteria bacterium]MCZ6864616.1 IPTL-CTERM sorting domain-containing protein [Candidatus Dadabacteria bacterium]